MILYNINIIERKIGFNGIKNIIFIIWNKIKLKSNECIIF